MFFNIFLFCLKGYSETLKTGITLACFKISGKVPNEKDQLIRLNIGLDKHFFEIFKNSGRKTTWASSFVCFNVLRMSSTSSFVVGDKKKEFSFKFFKYEWKDLGVLGFY